MLGLRFGAMAAWVDVALLTTGILCIAAVLFAGVNDRFGSMWLQLQAGFSMGASLLISVVVIALAAARLGGITYVTTVFDSAAWWTIGALFTSAYVLSWWFDYWLHRLLTDRVLRLLAPDSAGVADIPYGIDADAKRTSVPAEDRRLQIHGAARFLVVNKTGAKAPYFQALQPMQLIELLAASGAPGGKAVPTPSQIASRIANYQSLTALAFALVVGTALWVMHDSDQVAEAREQSEEAGVSLPQLLTKSPDGGPNSSLFVIAASGGGTRAAVYTAAILEAISRQGKAGDIVVGSGVSGGGAALAYFAGHRQSLVANEAGAWDRFFAVMTQPFIQDVLQRSTEWYMVRGGRLGMLLSDSFKRRWDLPPGRNTLHRVSDMGLILNTSLAGHFDRSPFAPVGQPLHEDEQAHRKETKSTLAGGRLLLTNLAIPGSLTSRPLEPDATLAALPVVIRGSQLRLEEAAALNANFPPVFSNAALDVDDKVRYWLTDGGAVDNRGMEMMLYAVRLALDPLPENQLPRLHIIVADASAFSSVFEQDRGLSTMSGAGSRYASHLDAELVEAIRRKYANHRDRFDFSYVMMPDILRESGSFGTHWMLQDTIRMRHVDAKKCDAHGVPTESSLTLSGRETVRLIRSMHSAQSGSLSADACEVLRWANEDKGHRDGWAAVLKAIGATESHPTCLAR